jgi:N-acetylneuraminic acid mutarotase
MLAVSRSAWKYFAAATAIVASAAVLCGGSFAAIESELASPLCHNHNPCEAKKYEWKEAPPLLIARSAPAVVVLADGNILVTGGLTAAGPADSTEIFDLASETWKLGPMMNEKRVGHTATLLKDGTVLIVGGDTGRGATASAEILNVTSFTSLAIPTSMSFKRSGHAAILLGNGKVLVTGGTDWVRGIWFQAETYDPAQRTWSPAGGMSAPRVSLSLQMLANGSVLAIGGNADATSEIYDPAKNTWSDVASMNAERFYAGVATLADGKILAAGGIVDGAPIRSSEVYDPATNSWESTGNMTTARASFSLTRIGSGALLAAGSYSTTGTTQSSELFYPSNSTWTAAQSMNVSRGAQGYAVKSSSDETFIISGKSEDSFTASVEVFAPIFEKKPKCCKPIDLVTLVLAAADDLLGHSEKGSKKCQTAYEAAGLCDSAGRYGSTITLAVFQMPVR